MSALPKKPVTQDAATGVLGDAAGRTDAKLDALAVKLDRYHAVNIQNFAELSRKLDLLMAHPGVKDET